jgi:hypothetical protein
VEHAEAREEEEHVAALARPDVVAKKRTGKARGWELGRGFHSEGWRVGREDEGGEVPRWCKECRCRWPERRGGHRDRERG